MKLTPKKFTTRGTSDKVIDLFSNILTFYCPLENIKFVLLKKMEATNDVTQIVPALSAVAAKATLIILKYCHSNLWWCVLAAMGRVAIVPLRPVHIAAN